MAQKSLVTWYDQIVQDAPPVEVTEALYFEAMDVMPPIYATGCFAVGEALAHDNHGYPIYHWFAEIRGRYYGFCGLKAHATIAFANLRYGQATIMDNYREYNTGLPASMRGPL